MLLKTLSATFLMVLTSYICAASDKQGIDYDKFLSQHDMVWDRLPNRWEVAPFSGNGNVGFLFYRAEGEAKNVISIHAGRHDYYDHRPPVGKDEFSWIYRSRLPLGHFNLQSKGDITGVELRLGLWNAELIGTITTSTGSPCFVQADIPQAKLYINGKEQTIVKTEDGFFQIPIQKGETALLTSETLDRADLQIEPLWVNDAGRNLFGLNAKTVRLPGHSHYYSDKTKKK